MGAEEVAEFIDSLGITVYGDSVAISAVVPAIQARSIVKALTRAYFAPVATEDGFREAAREVEQESQISSFDPETVVRDAVFSELFSAGPQHFPTLGAPKDIAQISLDDTKALPRRRPAAGLTAIPRRRRPPSRKSQATSSRSPRISSNPSADTAGSGPASPIRAKRPRWTSSPTTYFARTMAT